MSHDADDGVGVSHDADDIARWMRPGDAELRDSCVDGVPQDGVPQDGVPQDVPESDRLLNRAASMFFHSFDAARAINCTNQRVRSRFLHNKMSKGTTSTGCVFKTAATLMRMSQIKSSFASCVNGHWTGIHGIKPQAWLMATATRCTNCGVGRSSCRLSSEPP